MKKIQSILPWLSVAGLLLVLIGVALPLFIGIGNPIYCYFYAAGAFVMLASHLLMRVDGERKDVSLRVRRLVRMQSWSAIIFCAGAFFLFYNHGVMRDTVAFTLAGGVLYVYTSLMLARQRSKSADKS